MTLRGFDGSFRAGHVAGIEIRVHLTLIILGAWTLYDWGTAGELAFGATAFAITFGSVLLHEFGHCFAARRLGGSADRIILWPLGGLAMADVPPSPGAEIIVALAGPAVNALLMLATGPVLLSLRADLGIWILSETFRSDPRPAVLVLQQVFYLNSAQFLFNVLVMAFPLDGGRVVRGLLWFRHGEARSLRIASGLSMAIGVVLIVLGLLGQLGGLWLVFLASFVLAEGYASWRAAGEAIELEGPFAPGYRGRGFADWWASVRESIAERRRQRSAMARERIEARVDFLLEKVHRVGLKGLTRGERRFLRRASREYRS